MGIVEAVILGLTQGLTEFLPISSSAHLRLVPEAMGWDDPGASFTAVVQLGTIAAVLLAFRRELISVVVAGWRGARDRQAREGPAWRMAVAMLAGTIPIVVVGVLAADLVDGPFRGLGAIAVALLAGSAWLVVALRGPRGHRLAEDLSLRQIGAVGLAQTAALVPGVSRSGATIGAGLLLGLDASEAARFSVLLSVPAIVLAGAYGLRDLGTATSLVATSVAVVVAFISGYASIRLLLRLAASRQLGGFAIYRTALAVVILVVLAIR